VTVICPRLSLPTCERDVHVGRFFPCHCAFCKSTNCSCTHVATCHDHMKIQLRIPTADALNDILWLFTMQGRQRLPLAAPFMGFLHVFVSRVLLGVCGTCSFDHSSSNFARGRRVQRVGPFRMRALVDPSHQRRWLYHEVPLFPCAPSTNSQLAMYAFLGPRVTRLLSWPTARGLSLTS
jgi:hypothetical protein